MLQEEQLPGGNKRRVERYRYICPEKNSGLEVKGREKGVFWKGDGGSTDRKKKE